jgi:hypothetical protein
MTGFRFIVRVPLHPDTSEACPLLSNGSRSSFPGPWSGADHLSPTNADMKIVLCLPPFSPAVILQQDDKFEFIVRSFQKVYEINA